MSTIETQQKRDLAVTSSGGMLTTFKDIEQMYRFSEFLAKSPLLPDTFRGNPGSVMIALNMAQRLRMDPLMVCQNIVIVHGNAGISGKFAIALLNRSPKYRRIEYRFVNGKDYTAGIQVVGHRVDDPEDKYPDYGTPVTMEMARAEGWAKNPKWQTMPEQMMRYRAASFFARAFVPEELLGMQTAEELEDVDIANTTPVMRNVTPAQTHGLKVTKLATNELEQDEQDDAETPVVAGKAAEKDATNDATNEATTDEELLLQASLEEQEEALVWLDGILKQQKVSWSKVYRVCEALGMPHPVGGASRQEMANFALSVRMDREVRKALEESGITGIAMAEPKSPAKASRTAKKTVKTILDADKEEVTSDEATDLFLFAKKLPENVVM